MTTPSDTLDPHIIERGLECARCGYDLRGLERAQCPECGLPFDPNAFPAANVPWLRRASSGTMVAYYQTVWRVFIHPQDFGEQVWRVVDVDPRDAAEFARLTVWIATVSMVASSFEAGYRAMGTIHSTYFVELLFFAAAVTSASFVLFKILTLRLGVDPNVGTAAHRERFVQMQYFACAGLGLMPVVPIVGALATSWIIISFLGVLIVAWLGGLIFHAFGGRFGPVRLFTYSFSMCCLSIWAFLAAGAVLALCSWGIIACSALLRQW